MGKSALATFRVDEDKWKRFQALAKNSGYSASALLIGFIDRSINSGIEAPPEPKPSRIDSNLDRRIEQYLENNIDKRIEIYLERNLDRRIETLLQTLSESIGTPPTREDVEEMVKTSIGESEKEIMEATRSMWAELRGELAEVKKSLVGV